MRKSIISILFIILLTSTIWSHDLNNVWIESTVISVSYTTTTGTYTVQTSMDARVHTGYEWVYFTTGFSETTGISTIILTPADWNIIDDGDLAKPSKWTIGSSQITQTSNIYSNPISKANIAKNGTMAIYTNPVIGFTARLSTTDDDSMGIIFRYDGDSYARFEMNQQFSYWRLITYENNTYTVIKENINSYQKNQQYKIELKQIDNEIHIYVDGIEFGFIEGIINQVGLWCWGQQGMTVSGIEEAIITQFPTIDSTMIDHSYDTTFLLPFDDPDDALAIEILGWSYDTISTPVTVQIAVQERWKYIYKFDSQGQWVLEEVWRRVE